VVSVLGSQSKGHGFKSCHLQNLHGISVKAIPGFNFTIITSSFSNKSFLDSFSLLIVRVCLFFVKRILAKKLLVKYFDSMLIPTLSIVNISSLLCNKIMNWSLMLTNKHFLINFISFLEMFTTSLYCISFVDSSVPPAKMSQQSPPFC